MEDADDTGLKKTSRLLKPGEVRVVGMTSNFNNNLQSSGDRPFYQNRPDFYNHNLTKPAPSSTSLETLYPYCYFPPPQSHHPIPPLPLTTNSAHNLGSWRANAQAPESEMSFTRIFGRAPGTYMPRSDSNPSLHGDFSSPESTDSAGCLNRGFIAHQPCTNTVNTQTEGIRPVEEKFLIREGIIHGCETITLLAEKIPFLSEVGEYTVYLREKTVQSRAQNICSRIASSSIPTEQNIILEYVKSFIKIADSWLDARNCFGLSDRCCNTCSLDARDLSTNYVEWMHSSRLLLNSIVTGLEKVNLIYGSDEDVIRASREPKVSREDFLASNTGPGGHWGYPPNPPCNCVHAPQRSLQLEPMQVVRPSSTQSQPELPGWYHGHQPLYSGPPPPLANVDISVDSSEYMVPSSYDVPRKILTFNKKRSNISKAKTDAFQDPPASKGYVVLLPNTGSKRDVEQCGSENFESIQEEQDSTVPFDINKKEQPSKGQWLLSHLNPRETFMKNDASPDEEDSDVQGDDGVDASRNNPFQNQSWKNPKSFWCNAKKRRTLNQQQASRMQDVMRAMSKYDFPGLIISAEAKDNECQNLQKLLRNPVFFDTICNRVKSNLYETIEEFIYDCRRMFLCAVFCCQKNKSEKDKILKLRSDFEKLIEATFENAQTWSHITGDIKELSNPEQRFNNNMRRKPKSQKDCE